MSYARSDTRGRHRIESGHCGVTACYNTSLSTFDVLNFQLSFLVHLHPHSALVSEEGWQIKKMAEPTNTFFCLPVFTSRFRIQILSLIRWAMSFAISASSSPAEECTGCKRRGEIVFRKHSHRRVCTHIASLLGHIYRCILPSYSNQLFLNLKTLRHANASPTCRQVPLRGEEH